MGVADLRPAGAGAVRRLLVLLLAICGLEAGAHEIGTTQVRLDLGQDHRWTAIIVTAPSPLLNRLEAEAGVPLSRALTAAAAQERLPRFLDALARHVDIRFDGAAVPAAAVLTRVEMPDDITLPSFVEVTVSGLIPEAARSVQWRYELVSSTYAVVFADAEGGGAAETQWLEGDSASRPFRLASGAPPPTLVEIAAQYLQLGFLHILPEGLDHILFVLGIFLLSAGARSILIQVTAFTIAHSVTLGLTMYGVISLPSRVVEPLIALSVAYVAIENLLVRRLTPWRPAVVFCFGLLHGMGFAGVLTELKLSRADVVPALVSFNLGIELAQLTIIGAAYLAIALWHRDKAWYRPRFVVPSSLAIAAIGLFWTVQRAAGF